MWSGRFCRALAGRGPSRIPLPGPRFQSERLCGARGRGVGAAMSRLHQSRSVSGVSVGMGVLTPPHRAGAALRGVGGLLRIGGSEGL